MSCYESTVQRKDAALGKTRLVRFPIAGGRPSTDLIVLNSAVASDRTNVELGRNRKLWLFELKLPNCRPFRCLHSWTKEPRVCAEVSLPDEPRHAERATNGQSSTRSDRWRMNWVHWYRVTIRERHLSSHIANEYFWNRADLLDRADSRLFVSQKELHFRTRTCCFGKKWESKYEN